MNTQEVIAKLNKYKEMLDQESDADIKARYKSKISQLEDSLKESEQKVEKLEQKVAAEEQKELSEVEKKIKKYQDFLSSESDPEIKARYQKKIKELQDSLNEVKVEIKEEKKEIAEQKAEIKKAVKAVKSVKATKVEKKEAVKKVEKKVRERKEVTEKRTRRGKKIKKIMSDLDKLIEGNKKLKAKYTGKGVDLKKDAARSAKPFGYRFVGKHDYRVPTKAQIKSGKASGKVVYEGRANRSDVYPNRAAKLAYGGMMADGGENFDFIKLAIESASGDKISKTPNSQVYYSINNPQVAYYIKSFKGMYKKDVVDYIIIKYDAITGERYPIGELKEYMSDGGETYKNFGKHIINDYLNTKDGDKVYVMEGYYMYPSTDGVATEGIYYRVKYDNGDIKNISVDNLIFPVKVPYYGGFGSTMADGGMMAKGGSVKTRLLQQQREMRSKPHIVVNNDEMVVLKEFKNYNSAMKFVEEYLDENEDKYGTLTIMPKESTYASDYMAKGGMMAKGGKTPVIRTQFEEEEFEYGHGGMMGNGEFYVGQSILYKPTNNSKLDKAVRNLNNKYANKELVIEKIELDKPYNTAKVLDRNTGEKLPFEIKLNPRYVEQYAKGGHTQGYDDREDERLAMKYGRIGSKDLHSTHARRDDARFEERGKMAKGGYMADGGEIRFVDEFSNKNGIEISTAKTEDGKTLYGGQVTMYPLQRIIPFTYEDKDIVVERAKKIHSDMSEHLSKNLADYVMAKGGRVGQSKQDKARFAKPAGWRWKDSAVKKKIITSAQLSKSPSKAMREKYPNYVYFEDRLNKEDKNPSRKYLSA
jgi:hypothetical protein